MIERRTLGFRIYFFIIYSLSRAPGILATSLLFFIFLLAAKPAVKAVNFKMWVLPIEMQTIRWFPVLEDARPKACRPSGLTRGERNIRCAFLFLGVS